MLVADQGLELSPLRCGFGWFVLNQTRQLETGFKVESCLRDGNKCGACTKAGPTVTGFCTTFHEKPSKNLPLILDFLKSTVDAQPIDLVKFFHY